VGEEELQTSPAEEDLEVLMDKKLYASSM